ncbi:unnamed protein product [Polarella glacialis]|uniref:Secreted protein n=1 Tax=Polarella glacialis TaxID=89957 RepID=A0A813IM94_POLGL|nr:unnamed protein product [Polarella glacialis]
MLLLLLFLVVVVVLVGHGMPTGHGCTLSAQPSAHLSVHALRFLKIKAQDLGTGHWAQPCCSEKRVVREAYISGVGLLWGLQGPLVASNRFCQVMREPTGRSNVSF